MNCIITNLAIFDVTPDGLKLIETAPDVTQEELRKQTGVPFAA